MYSAEVQWPWLHTNGTQVTYSGQQEYTFPTAFRLADFDSFRIKPTERVSNGEFSSNISGWTTVSGSPVYSSTGNGRLRLDTAEVSQSAAADAAAPEDDILYRKRKTKRAGRSLTILTSSSGASGGLTLGKPSLLGS